MLAMAAAQLRRSGSESPEVDAQVLLAWALGLSRNRLLVLLATGGMPELEESQKRSFEAGVEKRKQGRPVAQITGDANFFGRDFRITGDVLIPRPETEELVEWILEEENDDAFHRVLDLCCGSGCIGLTLKAERPEQLKELTLSDISPAALAVATANAETLFPDSVTIRFLQSDLLNSFAGEKFSLIACNPPYVTTEEYALLMRDVKDFEPRIALEVPDPEKFFSRLFAQCHAALLPGGSLYVETNPVLMDRQKEMCAAAGFQSVTFKEDLSGKTRFLRGRK